MTGQFLEPLAAANPGHLELRDKEWFLLEPFIVPDQPIALQYGQFVVEYLEAHPELCGKIQGTKACLTGPFTLASALLLDDALAQRLDIKPFIFKEARAVMNKQLLETCARLLANIARAYTEMGFDIITMDEPTLSLLTGRRAIYTYKKDYVIDVLNTALAGIGSTSSIHVCGRVPPLLRDVLLESDVNIVDHEFTAEDFNFTVYSQNQLETHGKQLAFPQRIPVIEQ